jgi:hypothetical protein
MSFGNPFGVQDDVLSLGHNGFEVSLNYVAGLPDPNLVSDSTLKLIFKSLMKRDETTKEKALNELCNYISSENSDILKDYMVIMTWVKLYPKLSVSESKIVRALAHQAQTLFISVLQKSYMKYLKDTVPVLLSGIYDLDASVANSTLKSLGKAFNGQSKVNNLWIIFQSEILNFADQVFNKETVDSLSDDRVVPRDEAELKYLRLVNATISMISHLIQLGFKVNPEKLEANVKNYQDFLLYENLWHYLLVNTNVNNQRIYKTLLSLINGILKLKPELLTEKAWKMMSKRLLKSLSFSKKVHLSSPNRSMYSSLVVPILSTLNNLESVKPEFYHYDKSHKERITDFLKIGSLNSDPSYYTLLTTFIESSALFSDDDFSTLEAILHTDFQNELKWNSKLRNGTPFIVNSLECYMKILAKFDRQVLMSRLIDEIMEIDPKISKHFITPLAKYSWKDLLTEKLEQWSIKSEGYLKFLLDLALKTKTSFESTLDITLNDLREKGQKDEEGTTFVQHPSFMIFDLVVVENLIQYKAQFEEFFDELPSYITPLVLDQPISILIHYSKSELYNETLFIEIFDAFIMRLDMLQLKERLLAQLDKLDHKDVLLVQSAELKMAISEAAAGYDFSDDSLFKCHLLTKESAIELWGLAKQQGQEHLFLKYFFQNKNDDKLEDIITGTDLLETSLWTHEINKELHSKTQQLFSNSSIKSQYFALLKEFVSGHGSSVSITAIITELLNKSPELKSDLISENLTDEFLDSYGDVIDSRLSIGNPLQSNIYLLPTDDGSFQFKPLADIIRYSLFLASCGAIDDLLYLSMVSEVAIDYEFLNDGTHPALDYTLLNSQKNQFISKFQEGGYSSIVCQIISKSSGSAVQQLISENPILGFYYARLLKSILSSFTVSLSQLSELDIDGYVRSSIRSKAVVDQLIFQTVISTISSFFSDDRFERSRNLIASEIIGLRPNEILSQSVFKLLSLNAVLLFDEIPNGLIAIEPRRFNMIIIDLNKWLDSDVSYEPGFNKIRLCLIQLLQTLNSLNLTSEALGELTQRALQDSTGLVNLGEGGIELKYHTLKLFITLQKLDLLDSNVSRDVENELIDSYLNDKVEGINQPVFVYMELLHRVLDKLPVQRFEEHYKSLFEKYQFLTNMDLKRPLLSILKRVILSRQQDLVIEFELSKDDDLTPFKIPQSLIENIQNIPLYSDEEDDKDLISYLWHWTLVFLHFQNVSMKLRSVYIQQLQVENNELITKFLNFISLIIGDIDGKESDSSVVEYDYANDYSIDDELKLLSVHLYYTILVSIGSLASNWFTTIKDRGFKHQLERFTSKYISPMLIDNKLSSFETKISKFTEDENLSLKVNRITNEVKVTYLIDEQYLEVVFKIPVNYPLSNIEVSGPQRVGVKEQQWKAWLLASQRIISLQNGEISEALEFFLKNVAFHFKGFEECAVCYSILHQDNSLPSKSCQTCKNKFHSGCLYKWFKSSGGNTCPLCRSTFNFR